MSYENKCFLLQVVVQTMILEQFDLGRCDMMEAYS